MIANTGERVNHLSNIRRRKGCNIKRERGKGERKNREIKIRKGEILATPILSSNCNFALNQVFSFSLSLSHYSSFSLFLATSKQILVD